MKHYLMVYVITLVVMIGLDTVWLGGIASEFYKSRMGDQVAFNMVAGVVFYLMYATGIVVFVNGGSDYSWKSVLLYGACLGILAYGTYDLTNLATLKFWTVELVAVDMVWGSMLTAVAALCGWLGTRYLENL